MGGKTRASSLIEGSARGDAFSVGVPCRVRMRPVSVQTQCHDASREEFTQRRTRPSHVLLVPPQQMMEVKAS